MRFLKLPAQVFKNYFCSPSALFISKLALGAAAWQAVAERKGVTVSEDPLGYALFCLLCGVADSTVSLIIDTVSQFSQGSDSKQSCKSQTKKLVKNFVISTFISSCWQPAVDLGALTGTRISRIGADIFPGIFVFAFNAGCYLLLFDRESRFNHCLTAGFGEMLFYVSGPVSLPSSPSGNRTVAYAFLFTLSGAIFGKSLESAFNRISDKVFPSMLFQINDGDLKVPLLEDLTVSQEKQTSIQALV